MGSFSWAQLATVIWILITKLVQRYNILSRVSCLDVRRPDIKEFNARYLFRKV